MRRKPQIKLPPPLLKAEENVLHLRPPLTFELEAQTGVVLLG